MWLPPARYSRFALAEAKPQLEIRRAGGRTAVTDGPATVELDDDDLIEAVMGRLDETSGFSAALRAPLSSLLRPRPHRNVRKMVGADEGRVRG